MARAAAGWELAGPQGFEAAHLLLPLTTVRTDFMEIGRRCLSLMLDRLEHTPEPGVRVTIPTELVLRESCGPAPG
ncbi:substrate-binding domain-containing protein [Streptomyces iranensis]|uniref:substrate-binding domain-containing protein n=1 Tax=Streptomyces iranensis TaxID=576784 RepID=UPI0039B749B5